MSKPFYDAIIFAVDLDGTLVDTDAHLSQTLSCMYDKYGLAFVPADYFNALRFPVPSPQGGMEVREITLFGATWEDAGWYLKFRRPRISVSANAFAEEIKHAISTDRSSVTPRTDIIHALSGTKSTCAQMGIATAIIAVTNGSRPEAKANLALAEKHGLVSNGLLSVEDVAEPKPSPLPYLQGHSLGLARLAALGHKPERTLTLMFEDSPTGAKSACAAATHINDKSDKHQAHCFYVPTRKRPLLLPKLTADERQYFSVQQNIELLTRALSRCISPHDPIWQTYLPVSVPL